MSEALFFLPDALPPELAGDPFKALVAPRPIAWVSTVDAEGRANLAPFSYFAAVAENPHIVMIAPGGRKAFEPLEKDTLRNVLATGFFVVNGVGRAQAEAMNATSAAYPAGVDEFERCGVAKAPCRLAPVPRVADAPYAFECRFLTRVELPSNDPETRAGALFGQVIGVHLDPALIVEGRVDPLRWRPLARLGGPDYASVEAVFRMRRPDAPSA